MKGVFKKSLVVGAGAVLLLKEKLEKMMDEALRRQKIEPKEAEEVAREFFKQIEKRLDRISSQFFCARQINEIKQKLERLEEMIANTKA